MKRRSAILSASAAVLFCAGVAWLTTWWFAPATTTAPGPALSPGVPGVGLSPGEKPKPSVQIRRGVSRSWLDTLEMDYTGGYLDAWIDMEVYGVRDEFPITMPHLVKIPNRPPPAREGAADVPKGSINVVILHRFGAHESRAVSELLIDARSSEPWGGGGATVGRWARHLLPFRGRTTESWAEGGSPFNPTDGTGPDRDATTFIAFRTFTYAQSGIGHPHYPNFWGHTGTADPRLWSDRERRLGPPAARAAAAMLGLGGPANPALAAVPVVPTYQDRYLCGSLIQVKYRFLTEREIALLREQAGRADEQEAERLVRGFRRVPNRVDAGAGKE